MPDRVLTGPIRSCPARSLRARRRTQGQAPETPVGAPNSTVATGGSGSKPTTASNQESASKGEAKGGGHGVGFGETLGDIEGSHLPLGVSRDEQNAVNQQGGKSLS